MYVSVDIYMFLSVVCHYSKCLACSWLTVQGNQQHSRYHWKAFLPLLYHCHRFVFLASPYSVGFPEVAYGGSLWVLQGWMKWFLAHHSSTLCSVFFLFSRDFSTLLISHDLLKTFLCIGTKAGFILIFNKWSILLLNSGNTLIKNHFHWFPEYILQY